MKRGSQTIAFIYYPLKFIGRLLHYKIFKSFFFFSKIEQINMKSCRLLILYLTLVAIVVDEVTGVCCSPNSSQKCHDCSRGTPCCGKMECNIFCCECVGGCRTGNCSWKGSSPELSANPAYIFSVIDVNG